MRTDLPNYFNKKLRCRRETARCFVLLNVELNHSRSLKVIKKWYHFKTCLRFDRYGPIQYHFRDKATQLSKITPPAFDVPVSGFLAEYCRNIQAQYGKTRKSLMIFQPFRHNTGLRDRQTDGRTDGPTDRETDRHLVAAQSALCIAVKIIHKDPLCIGIYPRENDPNMSIFDEIIIQAAQLSQRGRAMPRVVEYFGQSLKAALSQND